MSRDQQAARPFEPVEVEWILRVQVPSAVPCNSRVRGVFRAREFGRRIGALRKWRQCAANAGELLAVGASVIFATRTTRDRRGHGGTRSSTSTRAAGRSRAITLRSSRSSSRPDSSSRLQLDSPDLAEDGFSIDDLFVVGYGLDYNERYRNLRDIKIYGG
jgi:transposase-like protein